MGFQMHLTVVRPVISVGRPVPRLITIRMDAETAVKMMMMTTTGCSIRLPICAKRANLAGLQHHRQITTEMDAETIQKTMIVITMVLTMEMMTVRVEI